MKIVSEGNIINKNIVCYSEVMDLNSLSHTIPHFRFRVNALRKIEFFQKISTPTPRRLLECVHGTS